MNIWALKGPSSNDYDEDEFREVQDFLTQSIREGISRFGWSYIDTADLSNLKDKPWHAMSSEEKVCWSKANFLIGVNKGDWIVHINLPYWGACLTGQVQETYSFERERNKLSDYRHTIKLDKNTITEFERNDDEVLPIISSRLKLQGRYWTIGYVDEFLQTINNLKLETVEKKEEKSKGVYYLKKDLPPLLKGITEQIQKNHPAGKLENFIAEVFRKVPNVKNVWENGRYKGWGTDNGADLVVTYRSGLSISNLEKEEKLVVQVKSYIGQHSETNAVEQIEEALVEFEASAGLIVTTAESTEDLEKAVESLSSRINKPIGLIAGEDVAKFVLKYGGELIF